MHLELVAITDSEEPTVHLSSMPEIVAEVVHATTRMYRASGYEPPWIGYLAIEKGECVGTCGFKSPPHNNRVEIAYFTFPGYESRGIATRMVTELTRIAINTLPAVVVAAQTLPEDSASTSVLKKRGFLLVGAIDHPEDGLVWEWQLGNSSAA